MNGQRLGGSATKLGRRVASQAAVVQVRQSTGKVTSGHQRKMPGTHVVVTQTRRRWHKAEYLDCPDGVEMPCADEVLSE